MRHTNRTHQKLGSQTSFQCLQTCIFRELGHVWTAGRAAQSTVQSVLPLVPWGAGPGWASGPFLQPPLPRAEPHRDRAEGQGPAEGQGTELKVSACLSGPAQLAAAFPGDTWPVSPPVPGVPGKGMARPWGKGTVATGHGISRLGSGPAKRPSFQGSSPAFPGGSSRIPEPPLCLGRPPCWPPSPAEPGASRAAACTFWNPGAGRDAS